MNGGKNKKPHGSGYTIVEVLIFLAISGFMFVVAAIFINGKQANAEFRQGVADTNNQIRTVINDVINGFYPSNNNVSCSVAGATSPPVFSNSAANQGGNLGCTFMGKVIQFDAANASGGHDGSHYNIYSIAGRQYALNSISNPPQSFTDAAVRAIDDSSKGVNATDFKTLQWGTTVTAMYSVDSGGNYTPIGAVGFFSSFGNFSTTGTLQSGSQSPVVALVPGSQLGQKESDMVSEISTINGPLLDPNVVICLLGANDKKASIAIGGSNGASLTTDVSIGGDPKC
jgi:type II secretory pathway pseudopilin PulG